MTQDPEAADPVRTGIVGVDNVIATVEDLGGRPVEDHVVVFESAHDHLRRALDHPSADPA